MLKIADRLSLPIDAVTQTFADIGRKGAGKTYLATMVAEQMLDREAQVLIIDPVGNWWGLRVGADGKSKGKDIFVIGGEHGDVPLVPEAGARIAKLVVERRISAVLDISAFRQGERKRFAAEFAEEFFHLKKSQRSAVHLFVEEAQLFAPQRCGPDEARMLGAFENIIRLGRNYGIGATLVSQRPQSVNKEVLSQVECLCVLQVNGTHERKALEEWVQEAGADRKLVGELPGLARGEGYVWSPSWLRIFQRVHFCQKTTFDASATPEVGKAAKAAKLSDVDVEALRASLQEVVAQAEKDDPKILRRQIADLQKQIHLLQNQKPKAEEKIIEVPAVSPAVIADLREAVSALPTIAASIIDALARVQQQPRIQQAPRPKPMPVMPTPVRQFRQVPSKPSAQAPEGISAAQVKILSRLVELMDCTGNDRIPKEQLAAWAEYSPTGGGYNNYLGSLRSSGLIDYPTPGLVTITDAGRSIAQPNGTPTTNTEMLERAKNVLGGSEGRLLEAVHGFYPEAITKSQLAEITEFSESGGGFNNYLGHMRTLGFIDYPQKGYVRASDWLFIE